MCLRAGTGHPRPRASIVVEDTTGKWRVNKIKTYLAARVECNRNFAPDRGFDGLVSFLSPEIAADLPKTHC